jgi:beta-lactamase regulating signal transducer with metallopeptidase domain
MTALLQPWAYVTLERVLNSLPSGILIALFAWTILRVLPKQNARTRFAAWFLALSAIVLLPWFERLVGGASGALTHPFIAPDRPSAISLPAGWVPFLCALWLAGAGIGLARLAFGIRRLYTLRKSAVIVPQSEFHPALRETLCELNQHKSLGFRSVTVSVSDAVRMPSALGLWKPTILLPAWALRELPPAELDIILRHEFAHLSRWDDWTNLFQKLARALFFFHPAVWWIESRLSTEREMACDDVVVAHTGNPTGYASCLVSLLERSLAQRGWNMAQAIVHRAREASLRLARILDKNRPAATQVSKPAIGLVGAFAVLCFVLLPQTPQVVGFEQNPASSAYDQYSAAVTRLPIVRAAFRPKAYAPTSHPAGRVAGVPGSAATTPDRAKGETSGSNGMPSSQLRVQPMPADVPMDAQNPQDALAIPDAAASEDESAGLLTVEKLIDEQVHAVPMLVVFRSAEIVQSGTGQPTVVWRVRVLRFTVFEPMRQVRIPPASST